MVKKGFVLYADKFEPIKMLSMEQRGVLLTAIYSHECGEELPDMDDMTKMMFMVIRQNLDEGAQRYAEVCEKRREAGLKGGRPRKANAYLENQLVSEKANGFSEKHNDNDNENDNDNDNDIGVTDALQGNAPSPRKRKEKVQRHKYGEYENVLLSDEEYQKVIAEYPADYQVRIDRLSEYMKSTGKSYKDHLATIRAWARKDKDKPQAPVRQAYSNSFHNFKQREYDYDALMERIREKNAL